MSKNNTSPILELGKVTPERLRILNTEEQQFIYSLQDNLEKVNLKEQLKFNVLSNKIINFKLNSVQIGRVKLNGRINKMQIITIKKVIWLDIKDVNEAILNIKHWIKYAKKVIDTINRCKY
jgi:hypothetical protein